MAACRSIAALSLAAASSAVLLDAQQVPTFRANTDLVVVDFTATTKDGSPTPDLKKEDLALTVAGKPREIRTLEFVRLAASDVPAEAAKAATPATFPPIAFGSNQLLSTGRTIYLVIDDESMPPGAERAARVAAARFIDSLPARDRVGLVTIPNGTHAVEPTVVRPRVRAALENITGHLNIPAGRPARPGDDGTGPILAAVCQTARTSMAALQTMFESLAEVSGPKTVVLISTGLYDNQNCGVDALTMQELGRVASRGRAQFYVLQTDFGGAAARSSVTPSALMQKVLDPMTQGVETLVGVTGGELFKISASGDAAFAKIARASSAFYLLGFDAEPSERNGKAHKVALTTTRSGIELRARPSFEIPDSARAAKATAATAKLPLERVLGDRKTYTDLPLSIVAHAARAADRSRMKVVVTADSIEAGAPLAAASFAIIDAKNRIVASWSADNDDLRQRPAVSAATVPAGEYRVRVAARDTAARLGAADFEFEAKLRRAGDFEISDLFFGDARGELFVPKFEYTAEATALGYLEIYAVTADLTPPRVIFQVASTTDGPTRAEALGKISPTRDRDRWFATASVPIADLPPGDYIARAILMQGSRIVGVAFRAVRKTQP